MKKATAVNMMSYKDDSTRAAVGRMVNVDDNVEAFNHLHGRAIFVHLKSLFILKNIYSILKEMKLQEGVVRCFGGLSVLIEFSSNKYASMAKEELLGRPDQFDSPVIWEGQPIPFDRVAWLKIIGVPLCITNVKVLNNIGSLYGTVVKEARVVSRGCDASFHFVGVLVDHGKRIQDEAFLRWRGSTFKVWVLEEYKEWIDDFVMEPKMDDGSSDDNDADAYSPEKQPDEVPTPEGLAKTPNMENINGGINGGLVSEIKVSNSIPTEQRNISNFGNKIDSREYNNEGIDSTVKI
ncbi:hypothetical protein HanOQP8_Chr17g0660771 [Helianthus annuus]|nr:hypothetical protein HanIR_Chr17g0871661 [Helianthus annuus]KAJ0447586.1 hypothetical protein HanHA89_Chr17g0707051 [Helianthus annuus]KAJ0632492.1 hypothetical protein HanLR1_Chr17g0665731 [Helianthus annuus]KAJ0636334.1 hypothetical protein HanOQP8_Chr17g0660771 [Helianthus annuus]